MGQLPPVQLLRYTGTMLGYLNLPNLMTFAGVILALNGCFAAWRGLLPAAMICLMLAGLCDLFDGLVARKLNLSAEEQAYGAQLDSLADVCIFGLAPVMMVLPQGASVLEWLVYGVYLLAVLTRLAWFNLYGLSGSGNIQHYTGLPVTYMALILPLAMILWFLLPAFLRPVWNGVVFGLMAALFVSRLPVPKPRGRAYALFPALALGLILLWSWHPWMP